MVSRLQLGRWVGVLMATMGNTEHVGHHNSTSRPCLLRGSRRRGAESTLSHMARKIRSFTNPHALKTIYLSACPPAP